MRSTTTRRRLRVQGGGGRPAKRLRPSDVVLGWTMVEGGVSGRLQNGDARTCTRIRGTVDLASRVIKTVNLHHSWSCQRQS